MGYKGVRIIFQQPNKNYKKKSQNKNNNNITFKNYGWVKKATRPFLMLFPELSYLNHHQTIKSIHHWNKHQHNIKHPQSPIFIYAIIINKLMLFNHPNLQTIQLVIYQQSRRGSESSNNPTSYLSTVTERKKGVKKGKEQTNSSQELFYDCFLFLLLFLRSLLFN